jgi:nicotinamide riboside kinase
MKVVICLYGGAGSGKSTTCADLFTRFKQEGFNAEMNREYIKEWVWEGRDVKPADQTYFFAKQARKERQYMQKNLDLIITDCPLLLTHFYGLKYDPFEKEFNTSKKMLEQHHAICKHYGYKVEHFFINRVKPYNPEGRFQTESEAKQLDLDMRKMLEDMNIKFESVDGDKFSGQKIYDLILSKYQDK